MSRRSSTSALLAAGLFALAGAAAPAQSRDLAAPLDFRGRMLISVSDADMLASAYVDGRLGPREGTDALSVIALGAHPRELRAAEVPVSISVAGPPLSVAVTPDGRFAIVVETWAPRPAGGDPLTQTFADLRHGHLLTVVDLADPARPRVAQQVRGLERPDSVSISADGALVAVTLHPEGAGARSPLALYPFRDGRLGEASLPEVPGWRSGDRCTRRAASMAPSRCAAWRPPTPAPSSRARAAWRWARPSAWRLREPPRHHARLDRDRRRAGRGELHA